MAPRKRYCDIGWEHDDMIDNNRLKTNCKLCEHIINSGGVTILKQHIAGGFSNTQDCTKCPREVKMAMKDHLRNFKKDKKKMKQKEEEVLSQLKQIDGERECFKIDDDEDDSDVHDTSMSAQEGKDVQRAKSISHREVEDLEERTLRGIGGSDSNHGGSHRTQNTQESNVHNRKTSITALLKDLYICRPKAGKQRRLEDSWTGKATRSLGSCISRCFLYNHIPENVANTPCFKTMVSEIQALGKGVRPPIVREISGV